MTQIGARTRVVSFDAEGTLVSHAFSKAIWREVVPELYGRARGLSPDEAAARVFAEYESVGPEREEWYDIDYWFRRFDLGDPRPVMQQHRWRVELYPEVPAVLRSLGRRYRLVVASSTPVEFLEPLLRDVRHLLDRVFSSTSECGRLKDAAFFRWLAAEVEADPGEIAHVGANWERDYVSATAAGCTALYLDRTSPRAGALTTLLEWQARLDTVASHPADGSSDSLGSRSSLGSKDAPSRH